jgi:hypothetical protein
MKKWLITGAVVVCVGLFVARFGDAILIHLQRLGI